MSEHEVVLRRVHMSVGFGETVACCLEVRPIEAEEDDFDEDGNFIPEHFDAKSLYLDFWSREGWRRVYREVRKAFRDVGGITWGESFRLGDPARLPGAAQEQGVL